MRRAESQSPDSQRPQPELERPRPSRVVAPLICPLSPLRASCHCQCGPRVPRIRVWLRHDMYVCSCARRHSRQTPSSTRAPAMQVHVCRGLRPRRLTQKRRVHIARCAYCSTLLHCCYCYVEEAA
eukprot:scaffold15232_cov115-Isochrysis_galbana.AAC.10